MPLHLGQRLHAFLGGLGQSSDARETRKAHEALEVQFQKRGLLWEGGREAMVSEIARDVMAQFDLPADHPQAEMVTQFVAALFDYEDLFTLPMVGWDSPRQTSDWWGLKDQIARQSRLLAQYEKNRALLVQFTALVFDGLWQACPTLLTPDEAEGLRVPGRLLHAIGHPGELVHGFANLVFAPELKDAELLSALRGTLEYNLILASGGNPADPRAFSRTPRYANRSDIIDPAALVRGYLGGTPLADLFHHELSVTIPTAVRFEHQHIVAGSGHGKTQTLQYLIAHDLDAVARGERSVIVLDSQGDLINNISNLALFAPGGALHDRVVIIDPTDVEYPVSLNLFDVGQDRLSGYAPLERERLTNSILELYDFVLGTLLEAGMTQKQSVIFRYVTRLMLHIPDATIHTLLSLMEPKAEERFAEDIAKLSGTARHFFETEFASREFEATKRQVLRRLWGILENQTFERMFSHPRSKLDLFAEMNAGKVILINTAKDLLKESGTEIFGRFFIALIAQAAQERATLPASARIPALVYIDEAADYFDRNVGVILSQARKYKVGMVLAHQYLGQLEARLQEAFATNTSIKMAGGVSAKDARALAAGMYCEPSLIEAQKKGSFASYIRGVTAGAIPLRFPFGVMEDLPKMSFADRDALQDRMRESYAVHYSELSSAGAESAAEGEEAEGGGKADPLDPNEPTPYW